MTTVAAGGASGAGLGAGLVRHRRRRNLVYHLPGLPPHLQPDPGFFDLEFLNRFPGGKKVDKFFQFFERHKFESVEYSKERFSSYRRRPKCSSGEQTNTATRFRGRCWTRTMEEDGDQDLLPDIAHTRVYGRTFNDAQQRGIFRREESSVKPGVHCGGIQ